jgi:16S rRNA (guanine527-N7)-methyltransferase
VSTEEIASSPSVRLHELLASAKMQPLQPAEYKALDSYMALLLRWNARMNLSAIRDENAILSRHFVESIACARALPPGIATLLDFGSGAGFPGIPIAICCPEIVVTLAESQGKKAAFLQEAARVLGLAVAIYSARAETLQASFDCVTLRAVDRMAVAVDEARRLVRRGGWLALMTTRPELDVLKNAAGAHFSWEEAIPLPDSSDRILVLAARHL